MVSSQLGLIGCSLLVVALALLKGATAESYTVGEDLGWNIPPSGSVAYATWAASKRFQLGDVVGKLLILDHFLCDGSISAWPTISSAEMNVGS